MLMASALVALALTGCGAPAGTAAPITRASGAPASSAPAQTAGSAPAPAPPTGRAPSRSFDVAVREDAFTRDGTRALPTTTWYPTTGGPFPLVIFSHGLRGRPEDFTALLTRWASAGFVVVAPKYPKTSRDAVQFDILDVLNQPGDASYVLTQVLAGPLRARINPARIAATGHSAGAITTVGLFTIGRDQRLSAGIVFAGAAIGVGTSFIGAPAPLLYVHGEADEVVSYASGKAVFDATPWPKALLSLPGQDHAGPYLRQSNKAYQAVSTSTVDFLRYTLYGDAAARARLAADAKPAGVLDDRL
jgi:dienelactone hydrolase